MVREVYRKYWKCDLNKLKKVKGIGSTTIKNLKKAGYKNVAQVYLDSTSAWGRLANIDGIGRKTAANLFREIRKAKICRD